VAATAQDRNWARRKYRRVFGRPTRPGGGGAVDLPICFGTDERRSPGARRGLIGEGRFFLAKAQHQGAQGLIRALLLRCRAPGALSTAGRPCARPPDILKGNAGCRCRRAKASVWPFVKKAARRKARPRYPTPRIRGGGLWRNPAAIGRGGRTTGRPSVRGGSTTQGRPTSGPTGAISRRAGRSLSLEACSLWGRPSRPRTRSRKNRGAAKDSVSLLRDELDLYEIKARKLTATEEGPAEQRGS